MTFKLEGGADIAAALRALADDKQIRRAEREALMAGAEPVRDRWKAEAPDDPATVAANYKGAVAAKRRSPRNGNETVDVGIDRNVDPPRIVGRKLGRGTYRDPGIAGVAPIIEFGRDGVPANPVGRRAMDAELPLATERVGRALWPAIERAAARIARKAAKGRK